MDWRAASLTLLLVGTGWTQTSGDTKPPEVRSPFASPVRAVLNKANTSRAAAAAPAAQKPANAPKPMTATVKPAAASTGTPRAGAVPHPVRAASKPMEKPVAVGSKVAVAPAAAKPAPASSTVKAIRGSRDPFVSPVSATSAAAAACFTGGKKCLAIDKIMVRGIVRSESGYIALVVNAANRAYFLRENDPLMNGYVLRITSQAVTFKETGKDRLGHATSRDVTKTLNGPEA